MSELPLYREREKERERDKEGDKERERKKAREQKRETLACCVLSRDLAYRDTSPIRKCSLP